MLYYVSECCQQYLQQIRHGIVWLYQALYILCHPISTHSLFSLLILLSLFLSLSICLSKQASQGQYHYQLHLTNTVFTPHTCQELVDLPD